MVYHTVSNGIRRSKLKNPKLWKYLELSRRPEEK